MLSYRPDILVATPGRYWDIVQSGEAHLSDMSELRYFVIDEADRMIADGYFPELRSIINLITAYRKHYASAPHLQKFVASATMTLDERLREHGKRRAQQERNLIGLFTVYFLKAVSLLTQF